ncbi:MAG: hypothetical protein WCE63_07475 [Acidobacteriaceae bacterium]
MPRFNERTHSKTKVARLEELFEAIKNSRDPLMQEVADDIQLRRTFGRDSVESESSQYDPSESNVSNAQSHYDSEKTRLRNLGTNGDSFDRNRSKVMSEVRHDDSLTKVNAERSKDFSSFSKHPDQPSLNSSVVFDSFREGSRQHRRA